MITVQKGWHDTPETLLTLCGDLRFRLRERIQIEIFPSINRERSFRDLLGKLSKSDLFDGERKVLLLFLLLFISVLSYSMLAIYIAQRRRFVILYENVRVMIFIPIYRSTTLRDGEISLDLFRLVRKFRQGDYGWQLAKGTSSVVLNAPKLRDYVSGSTRQTREAYPVGLDWLGAKRCAYDCRN